MHQRGYGPGMIKVEIFNVKLYILNIGKINQIESHGRINLYTNQMTLKKK